MGNADYAKCIVCGKDIPADRKGNSKYCSLKCLRMTDTGNTYKRISDNSHKGYLSKELIAIYGWRCAICGWRASEDLITVNGQTQYAHGNEIHHIVAVKDGGRATFDNLILLCPNHHKQADLKIISLEELRRYLKQPPTESEKQKMKIRAADTVAKAVFGG